MIRLMKNFLALLIVATLVVGVSFAQESKSIKICKDKSCANPTYIAPDKALIVANSILHEGKEKSVIKFCEYSQNDRSCKNNHLVLWNFGPPPIFANYTTIDSLHFVKKEDEKFFYSIRASNFGISALCNKVEAAFVIKELEITLDTTNYCNWLVVGNVMSNLTIKIREINPIEKKMLADFTAGLVGTSVGKTSGLLELTYEGFDWIVADKLLDDSTLSSQKIPTAASQNNDVNKGQNNIATSYSPESNQDLKVATLKEAALKEAAIKEAAIKEAAIKEAAIKEAAIKEAAIKEAAIKEAALKEAALKEAALKEATSRDESSKKLTASNQNSAMSTLTGLSKEPAQSVTKFDSASKMKLTALIIGNGNYKNGYLKNPKNDAEEIGKKLSKFNFDVTTIYDTSREKLIQALDAYSHKSKDSDVSLFFYAGHGVQVNGMNYLIPVDMEFASVSQVTLRGIPLNNVIEEFMPSKTKLIFLDACRDNPLLMSKTRNLTRGLAPVNVPSGTLIAFSTKDGSVAQDGEDKNSPFTSALLKHLDAPEDISVVLRKVRTEVKKLTNGNQEPWDYGSLEGGSLILSKIGFNN
jgi:uncharacterized protein YjbI with pentapeptide repeats